MQDIKYENGKLVVPTKNGNIVVSVKNDDLYPGIYIDFESKNLKEEVSFVNEAETPTMQLALVEYKNEEEELSTYIWEKAGEDYSDKIIYKNIFK